MFDALMCNAFSTALTDTTYAKGVFIEMFITAALVMAGMSSLVCETVVAFLFLLSPTVLMLAAEKHEATPFAPVSTPVVSAW